MDTSSDGPLPPVDATQQWSIPNYQPRLAFHHFAKLLKKHEGKVSIIRPYMDRRRKATELDFLGDSTFPNVVHLGDDSKAYFNRGALFTEDILAPKVRLKRTAAGNQLLTMIRASHMRWCRTNPGQPFLLPLMVDVDWKQYTKFDVDEGGHANSFMVMSNRAGTDLTVARFEPHGDVPKEGDICETAMDRFGRDLATFLRAEYLEAKGVRGPQAIEGDSALAPTQYRWGLFGETTEENIGYCAMWSVMYLQWQLDNPSETIDSFIALFAQKTPDECRLTIRGYVAWASDGIDPGLLGVFKNMRPRTQLFWYPPDEPSPYMPLMQYFQKAEKQQGTTIDYEGAPISQAHLPWHERKPFGPPLTERVKGAYPSANEMFAGPFLDRCAAPNPGAQ